MTKIYMYGVAEHERPFIDQWKEAHPDVDLTLDTDILNAETASRAEGADGVSSYQYAPTGDEVYATFKSFDIKNIAQRMAGFDPYNLDLASENDIVVSNVPAYSPASIAEHTVMQALNAARNAYTVHDRVQAHNFQEGDVIRGERLGNMKVAIIGTGRIGATTGRLLKGFGCEIVGYDIYQNDSLVEEGLLEYVDTVEEAVADADIVSLHLPATDETTHMFNTELFSKFKDGAILLNPGRGALIKTEDLLDALNKGKVGKAAIDTYENEFDYVKHDYRQKEVDDTTLLRLIHHPNVSWTPHIAYYTTESVRNMVFHALDATLDVVNTGTTDIRVN